MTAQERQLIMSDAIAAAKAKVVNELRDSLTKDVISGNASASISAAGGAKSWGKMSTAERLAMFNVLKKDLNDYIERTFGIDVHPMPHIRHVAVVRRGFARRA